MNLSGPKFALNVARRGVLVVLISGLAGVLVAGLIIPIAASLGVVARDSATEFGNLGDDLDLEQPLPQRSRIVDSEGRTIATFYDENRIYVQLDKIAPVMIDAILAIEDHRYYEHGPIDVQGTIRAFTENLQAGEITGGGSTLTQQYVKLLQVSLEGVGYSESEATDETYRRKLEELRLALQVEQQLTKDEILERYLNIAYFGNGAHGIQAAARAYFSTSAAELTLEQAALLAGLVQQPGRYDPTENEVTAIGRRNTVLDRMADDEVNVITEAQAQHSKQADLGLELRPTPNGCDGSPEPFFCDYVERLVLDMEELGETEAERARALRQGGLTIHTTLDRDIQRAAQEAVSDRVDPTDDSIAALASVEPGTGQIKAIAQSRPRGNDVDGGESRINFAVDHRYGGSIGAHPGSTYKAWVLAAAIEQGVPLDTSFNSPYQIRLPVNSFDNCEGPIRSTEIWDPVNYSRNVSGRHNVLSGTEQSVNTFYAQLEQLTGVCDPVRIATEAGITKFTGEPLTYDPSFVLGTNETSPLAMAEGYATFAARGVHCESFAISKIVDRSGNVNYEADANCKRVLAEEVADGVNYVLNSVVENGTGRSMRLDDGRDAGGKTGTTNDTHAVWWLGFIPQLTTAVGVWDPRGKVDPDTGELLTLNGRSFAGEVFGTACGGCIPGPIWKNMMEAIIDKYEPVSFPEPSREVVRGKTDPVPDVRGFAEAAALDALDEEDFQGYVAEEEEHESIPEGQVIRTIPGTGSEHPIGGRVGLVISLGPPPEPEPTEEPEPEPTEDPDPPDNGGGPGGDGGDDDG